MSSSPSRRIDPCTGHEPAASPVEGPSSPNPAVGVPVVAAVIRRDGRYLVARRPRNKRHGGLWEFPGGKVREGEDLLAAARRELGEELALRVRKVGEELFRSRDPGSPFVIRFVEVEADGDPRPLEHSELGWYRVEELAELRLAPADARFVRHMGAAEE